MSEEKSLFYRSERPPKPFYASENFIMTDKKSQNIKRNTVNKAIPTMIVPSK